MSNITTKNKILEIFYQGLTLKHVKYIKKNLFFNTEKHKNNIT